MLVIAYLIYDYRTKSSSLDAANTYLKFFRNEHRSLMDKCKSLESTALVLQSRIKNLEEGMVTKDILLEGAGSVSNDSVLKIASAYADFRTMQFELTAKYLETKKHPARKEASNIREVREVARNEIAARRVIQYKLEYLFSVFPDLEFLMDDISTILEIGEQTDAATFSENLDRTRNYLSNDEYQKLPEASRNQLALDRYIERRKSKWQIGRDFEMFVGYEYEQDGWKVEYTGIEQMLEDMGRDIVASKNGTVHIIQCKYWAAYKVINENHICQLFGTAIQYSLEHRIPREKVLPVFITNIELSERATRFADFLDIKVIQGKSLGEFPRIKCNINRSTNEKIYHLPMDQQYDRTRIVDVGECFAFTVEEAMSKGFRRAQRWLGDAAT